MLLTAHKHSIIFRRLNGFQKPPIDSWAHGTAKCWRTHGSTAQANDLCAHVEKNNHCLIKIDWDVLNQIPTLGLWRKEKPQQNRKFHFYSLLLYIDNPSIDFHAFQSDYKLFQKKARKHSGLLCLLYHWLFTISFQKKFCLEKNNQKIYYWTLAPINWTLCAKARKFYLQKIEKRWVDGAMQPNYKLLQPIRSVSFLYRHSISFIFQLVFVCCARYTSYTWLTHFSAPFHVAFALCFMLTFVWSDEGIKHSYKP